MKRFLLLFAVFGLMSAAVSCIDLDNQDGDNPQYFSFATVHRESASDGASVLSTAFISDTEKLLVPVENYSYLAKLRDGQRVVLFFNIEEGSGEDNETARIRLFQVDTTVTVAKSARVETDKDIEQYGTSRYDVTISPYYPTMTPKYINLHVGFYGAYPEKHDFTVLYSEETPDESGKLKLTLAHDSNKDDAGLLSYRWLSVPLEDYTEMFPLYNSLLLYVNTIQSGYQCLEFIVSR